MQQANHHVCHQYEFLSAQIAGNKCLLHKGEKGVPCRVPDDVDSMVLGSPCNPFSRMTNKRFHQDSVVQHRSYNTTFVECYDAFVAFEPRTATMEQSDGFGLPYDSGTEETPLQRLRLGTHEWCTELSHSTWRIMGLSN